jgi:UDP-glucuronate decarboxylase
MGKKAIKNIVTGGAGFLGSHLIDKLMYKGESVICLDNFLTGDKKNIRKWYKNKNFELINHDLTKPIFVEGDRIWHLGCPASPSHYQTNPIYTAKTIFLGTLNMLDLAKKLKSKIFLASSSEIYGDPKVHPQTEDYFGFVNPIGIRSCYTEGKRIAETLFFDYQRLYNLDIRVARIFNTYGPRMTINDGRVMSNFINQSLRNQKITIYGDGKQTRSFCYVDDTVRGLIKLMESSYSKPVNIGHEQEITIFELALLIKNKINPNVKIEYCDLPIDEPRFRNPCIEVAKNRLKWIPRINLSEGLDKTIKFFKF